MIDHFRGVRRAYDTIAADYTAHFGAEAVAGPFERAMFAAFAELVTGPVVEVGSGPGGTTAHLHGLDVDIRGIDLSPAMIGQARRAHPGLRFDEGTMTSLDVRDGELGAIVAWYSIIHLPPAEIPTAFAEFDRALAPGGHLLLGFQVGDEPKHYSEAFGHEVDLAFHRLRPENITAHLTEAGFTVAAELTRAPEGPAETTPQAYILARKP